MNIRYKTLRMLVQVRAWANTPEGEKIIVRTLTILSVLLIIDIILLTL